MNIHRVKVGFVYTLEQFGADGKLKNVEQVHNLMPDVARDYLLNTALLGGSQFASWYLGLYSSAYTPVAGSTMANIIASATEITSYTGTERLTLTPDALSGGVFSNVGTPAVFEFAGAVTVRGGFISSEAVQGSSTGLLLSAALFPSPKVFDEGGALRVTAGLALITT